MGKARPYRVAVGVGLTLLASVFAFLHLGTPSWFIDEVFSVQTSVSPLGDIYGHVRHLETSPPGYFWLLHEWVGRPGLTDEAGFRALSAIAGVALALCVWWVGDQVADPPVGAIAGVLTALSPFVVQYEQLARPYALLMLALAIAVAAAMRARADARWLVVCALAAVAALWVHYTAWVAVLPLCAWVALDRRHSARARAAFVLACLAGGAVWLPLAHHQFTTYPNGGELPGIADLTPANLLTTVAGPFEGRHPLGDVLRGIGVATVLGGLVAFAACRSIEARRRGLILSLAILPVVALVLLGAAGKDIVIPRYAAEGIPFTLVALGAALARSPRPVAILLAAGTAVVGGAGLVAGERRNAFYADARGAVRTIAADARPGDAVVTTGRLVIDYPFRYYAVAGLPRGVRVIQPPLRAHPPRLWMLSTGGAAPPGYRLARFRHLAGDPPIDVLLLEATAR